MSACNNHLPTNELNKNQIRISFMPSLMRAELFRCSKYPTINLKDK